MLETESQLKDTYVADGQVRLIYKHYPLPSHERASQAAEAAECAARQGMFWDMKTLLFERNGEYGHPLWHRAQEALGRAIASLEQPTPM